MHTANTMASEAAHYAHRPVKQRLPKVVLTAVISFLLGLYGGLQVASQATILLPHTTATDPAMKNNCHCPISTQTEESAAAQQSQAPSGDDILAACLQEKEYLQTSLSKAVQQQQPAPNNHNHNTNVPPIFGPHMARIATAAARVSKREFMRTFDYGLPTKQHQPTGAAEVLLLYPSCHTLPSALNHTSTDNTAMIPRLSLPDALEHCPDMNVVFIKQETNTNLERCLAVVAGPGAHHVLRWRRQVDEPLSLSKLVNVAASFSFAMS
jgi:hypothetical protein